MQQNHHLRNTWLAIFVTVGAITAGLAQHLISAGVTPGLDFASFYAAGKLVHEHGAANLYDRALQESALKAIGARHRDLYYVHPPFELLAFAPLARFSLNTAYLVWITLNFLALLAAAAFLLRSLPLTRYRYLVLASFLSFPVLHALGEGEDSCILLLAVCACYFLMRHERPLAAGLVLSLMAIKFHYLIILAALLLVARRYRVLAGVASGVAALLALSVAVVGVHGVLDYFHFLSTFNANGLVPMSIQYFPNVRGFFYAIGWGQTPALFAAAAIIAAAAFVVRGIRDTAQSFALSLITSFVGSPYGHIADATLLLFPLMVAFGMGSRSLLAASAMVIIAPFLMAFAGYYHWSLCFVVFFVFLAVFLWRCVRQNSVEGSASSASPS